MRESIGNSMIFSIIITIIAISTALVLFSLGYSKTYRIKNKVIDIIESNQGYNNSTVRAEVETYMRDAGYSSYKDNNDKCPSVDGINAINDLKQQQYMYCIYSFDTVKGRYFTVRVYMTYHLPLVSDFIDVRYSIRGDSSVIFSF